MRKLVTRSAAAVLLALAAGYLARNFLARRALESLVQRQTGFPLRVGAVELGLFEGRMEVRDVQLENPPAFHERTFLELPLLRVEGDVLSLLRGKPHLRSLSLEVKEVFIVTNAKGDKNSRELGRTSAGGERSTRKRPYRVDLLHVRVGAVTIVDDSRGKRSRHRLELNVDRTYRNVSEVTSMSELVLGPTLLQLGPAAGEVGREFGEAVRGAGNGARRAGSGLLQVLRGR